MLVQPRSSKTEGSIIIFKCSFQKPNLQFSEFARQKTVEGEATLDGSLTPIPILPLNSYRRVYSLVAIVIDSELQFHLYSVHVV